MSPISKIIGTIIRIAAGLRFFFMKRYVMSPKKTMAIVACPLGKESVVSGSREFIGRDL